MIRGVLGVVPYHKAEVGRFYISTAYGSGNWLFQCVKNSESGDGEALRKALVLTIAGKPDLFIEDIPDCAPLVSLYDVHTRIDPTSLNHSADVRPSRFFVVDESPVVCVPAGPYGRRCINLSTGMAVFESSMSNSVSFDRWSLVLDDDVGDELTIASFAEAT